MGDVEGGVQQEIRGVPELKSTVNRRKLSEIIEESLLVTARSEWLPRNVLSRRPD